MRFEPTAVQRQGPKREKTFFATTTSVLLSFKAGSGISGMAFHCIMKGWDEKNFMKISTK